MASSQRSDIAYHRAKYPTRCMLCGRSIKAGEWIAKPASELAPSSRVKTKAAWSHPDCLNEGLRTGSELSGRSAAIAYRMRRRRRDQRHEESPTRGGKA